MAIALRHRYVTSLHPVYKFSQLVSVTPYYSIPLEHYLPLELRIGGRKNTSLIINILCLCTAWQTTKHGNCIFSINETRRNYRVLTAEPSIVTTLSTYKKQDQEREHGIRQPSVMHTFQCSTFTRLCLPWSRPCVKMFFVESGVKVNV